MIAVAGGILLAVLVLVVAPLAIFALLAVAKLGFCIVVFWFLCKLTAWPVAAIVAGGVGWFLFKK